MTTDTTTLDLINHSPCQPNLKINTHISIKQTLETIASPCYLIDEDGLILFCNHEKTKELGLASPEEAIGKNLLHIDSSLKNDQAIKPLTEQTINRNDTFIDSKDNNQSITIIPLNEKINNKSLFIHLGIKPKQTAQTNNSELSRKQPFIHMFNRIIELMPGNIAYKDEQKRYLGCNQAYIEHLGLISKNDIIGKTDEDIHLISHPNKSSIEEKVFKQKMTQCNEEVFNINTKEQSVFLTQYAPLIIENNQVKGIVQLSMDITKQKKLIEEIALEKQKAEKACALKDEFIKNMCHDIRTPFCGLISLSEHLSETEHDESRKQDLTMIKESAETLLDLLNTIVSTTALEKNPEKDELCSINLNTLSNDLSQMFLPTLKNKNIKLSIYIDESLKKPIISNKNYFHRIILNLMSNAIKYTKDGHIKLSFVHPSQKTKNKKILCSISDTGIGIPNDKLQSIFEEFTQIEQPNHHAHGEGLGLHLVKNLVNKLGGEIHVESNTDIGTRFFFTFPYENKKTGGQTTVVGHKKPITRKQSYQGKTILLVEDSEIAQRAGRCIFETEDCQCIIAEDAKNALQLPSNMFDLVIIDLGLPDISGELLAEILKTKNNYTGKIVALSATEMPTKEGLKSVYYDDFIQKPLTKSKAISILEKYL